LARGTFEVASGADPFGTTREPKPSREGMFRRRNEPYGNRGGLDSLLGESRKLSSSWESIEPEPSRPVHTMFSDVSPAAPAPASASASAAGSGSSKPRGRRPEAEDDSAVKKFGSAKAISSAQFFGEQVNITLNYSFADNFCGYRSGKSRSSNEETKMTYFRLYT
jgi:hypothetical protein